MNDLTIGSITFAPTPNINARQLNGIIDPLPIQKLNEALLRITELEQKLKTAVEDENERCAKKCEQRANSLREGMDVANLCARDIRNGRNPYDL